MGNPWEEKLGGKTGKANSKTPHSAGIYFFPPGCKDVTSPINELSLDVISALKPMVGWNEDNDKYVKDLCCGKLTVESMGHAGPTASRTQRKHCPK